MNFTTTELLTLVESWLWPFLRVAALLTAAPIIGTRAVPPRIRIVLAVAITAVVLPVLPAPALIEPLTARGLAVAAQQVLIGIVLGLSVRFIFSVFELTGQLLGQQMGLSFAAMVDPQSGNQVPVISQFYVLITTLLFLSLNGHLLLIEALGQSFSLLPIGGHGVSQAGGGVVLHWAGELFGYAVLIALPAIAALLIVNLAFGVLARATPQLNIFAVGFPLTILVGVAVVWLTVYSLEQHLSGLMERSLETVRDSLMAR